MPRPPKDPQSRLEKLLKQENQLKNKIQLAKNRLQAEISKERSARLFAWGMVIEEQLKSGLLAPETWKEACLKSLKDHRLQKALTGPLASVESDPLEPTTILPSPSEHPLTNAVKTKAEKAKPSKKSAIKTTKQPKAKKPSTTKRSKTNSKNASGC